MILVDDDEKEKHDMYCNTKARNNVYIDQKVKCRIKILFLYFLMKTDIAKRLGFIGIQKKNNSFHANIRICK